LVASKAKDQRPAETVVYFGKMLDSTGEVVKWKHGYEGIDLCGGLGQALFRQNQSNGEGDVLIRLPGRALDWIRDRNLLSESELNCTDADICRLFTDNDFEATRIDVAMDTNDPAVSPQLVRETIDAQSFTGHIKKAGLADSWDIDKPETAYQNGTFYLGSRQSTRYLRVYNKQAEVLKATGQDIGHLTRFELEVKGEAATKVLKQIEHYGSYCIPSIFAGWINFRDSKDDNARMDRKDVADWWDRMVGGYEPIVLGLTRSATTPERSLMWLKNGVAKTLALADEFGLMPEIQAAMENARHKIKESERKQWAHFEECRKTGKSAATWESATTKGGQAHE